MRSILALFLFCLASAPIPSPAACPGADLAVTSVTVQSVTPGHYVNWYKVVGTVKNVGSATQTSDVMQFVDINQYGSRLDDRGVPPLAPGQSYSVAYLWKRASDAGNRTTPLDFRLRMVSPADSPFNECNPGNDLYSITF